MWTNIISKNEMSPYHMQFWHLRSFMIPMQQNVKQFWIKESIRRRRLDIENLKQEIKSTLREKGELQNPEPVKNHSSLLAIWNNQSSDARNKINHFWVWKSRDRKTKIFRFIRTQRIPTHSTKWKLFQRKHNCKFYIFDWGLDGRSQDFEYWEKTVCKSRWFETYNTLWNFLHAVRNQNKISESIVYEPIAPLQMQSYRLRFWGTESNL